MKSTEKRIAFRERLNAIEPFIPANYCTIINYLHPHLSKATIYAVRRNAYPMNEEVMQALENLATRGKAKTENAHAEIEI
jgi:hypothetical protein